MTSRKPHRRASGGTVTPGASGRSIPAPPPAESSAASAAEPAPAEPSVLKVKAPDDDPRVWGDAPEDRDSWLLEQRPPHWD